MESVTQKLDLLRLNPAEKIKPSGDIADIFKQLGLINLVFFIIGAIFMFGLIGAAVSYINAQGSPEAINKANSRIINSLIGLSIVFGSFIIVRLVLATIGSSDIVPF